MVDLRTDLTDQDASATLHATLHNQANGEINKLNRRMFVAELMCDAPTGSGSLFCYKGIRLRPSKNLYIHYITGSCVGASSFPAGSYKGVIVEGTTSVTAVTSTPVDAVAAAVSGLVMEFTTPVLLTAGTTYGLAVGRTDAGDAYGLPMVTGGAWVPPDVPGLVDGFIRIAAANPVVGSAMESTVTTATSAPFGTGFAYTLA